MHRPVILPKPYMLGDPRLKPMFDKIYHVALGACEVEEFEKGGRLHHFGENLLCVNMMWYVPIRDRFGESNGYVKWLQELFEHCQAHDVTDPDLTPKLVLEKWSKTLHREFERQNNHVHDQDFTTHTMQEVVGMVSGTVERLTAMERELSRILKTEPQRTEMFAELMRNHQTILLSIDKTMTSNKTLLNRVMDEALANISEDRKRKAREQVYSTPPKEIAGWKKKSPPSVEFLTTKPAPQAQPEPPSKAQPLPASQSSQEQSSGQPPHKMARSGSPVFNTTNHFTVNSSNVHFSGAGNGPRSEQSNFAAIPAEQSNFAAIPADQFTIASIPAFAIGKAELAQTVNHRKAVDEMMRSRKIQQPAKDGLGGTVLLHEHLQRQHQCGAFKGSGPLCRPKDPVPYYCLKDQVKLHYCMEACDAFLPESLIEYLKGPFDPRHKGIYEEMQQITMDGMSRLEGNDPELEKELAGKKVGKKKKGSISALGRRVKDYKNLVRKNMPSLPKSTGGRYDTTPLHPRHMWETNVGTPPGNTSIATFFGRAAAPQQLELEEVTTTTTGEYGEYEDEDEVGNAANVI